jgi:hypothetical protein
VIPLTARRLRRSTETTRPAPDPHDVSGRQSSIAPLPRAEFSEDITLLTTNVFSEQASATYPGEGPLYSSQISLGAPIVVSVRFSQRVSSKETSCLIRTASSDVRS